MWLINTFVFAQKYVIFPFLKKGIKIMGVDPQDFKKAIRPSFTYPQHLISSKLLEIDVRAGA